MDVNAIAQAVQTQQQPVSAQDSGNGSTADMFAYLLKHQFGSNVSKHALVNTQAAIDMVGTPMTAPPPAPVNTAPQVQTQQNNAPVQQNQQADTGNGNNQSSNTTAAAANTNTNDNSANTASNNTDTRGQQNTTNANTGNNSGSQATTQTASTQAQTKTGEDETTEATAAVMAATVYLTPQQQAVTLTPIQAANAVTKGPDVNANQAQQSTDPTTGAAAAQTARQMAASTDDDASADETHLWTANFLNSNAPTTPQAAQQAASLAKITGSSGATVSTQTTTGTTTTASSTSTLVPDAVMAVPSAFSGSDHGTSTGGGTGDQQTGQQTNDNAPQAVIDPSAQALAQDMQALSAISALLQGSAQSIIATQQNSGIGSVAAATADTAATEAALPQPTMAPTAQNTAAPSNFAQQLQETEEPEEPEAPKQTQLPSAVDQIKMEIEKGVAAGSSTIKVQLNPDNMGRVDVKLEVQNGSVKATISADHPETLALLKSDQQGMVQALQDAGLNADSNSLSFYLRGDQQQRQFAQSGNQGRGKSGNGDDATQAIAGVAASSGASAANAASSALDISV